MFVLIRALTYASVFIGVLLVYLPAQLLERAGVTAPSIVGPVEILGLALAAVGASLAIACVLTFAVIGRGTPAPFDPPRRLVVSGPYRWVRNPMYLGAGTALAGSAVFYRSTPLLGFTALFMVITHLFVRLYEEPALRRTFGDEYRSYCARVARWIPRPPSGEPRRPAP